MKVFLFSFFFLVYIVSGSVYAQENATSSGSVASSPQAVDYELPYPGLLPDNPLYGIKMFRDRVVLMLISDASKRARFNLLQADKRLQAGLYLYRGNKDKLQTSLTTLSKSQNYFSAAIAESVRAEKEGQNIEGLLNDLTRASLKHEELLKEMEKSVPRDSKDEMKTLLKKMNELQKELSNLL